MKTETTDRELDCTLDHELGTVDKSPTGGGSRGFLDGAFGKIAVKAPKKPSNPRGETIQRIRALAPAIIAKHNAKFVSAAMVQAELAVETGMHFNANFLGDCLGGHGLNLPRVSKRSKVRYALHMVESTDTEKTEAQTMLDGLTAEQRAALIVA